jgi:hypothetical protein
MWSPLSGAHSRGPLASPNTRGAASGSTALIQGTPEAISAAIARVPRGKQGTDSAVAK